MEIQRPRFFSRFFSTRERMVKISQLYANIELCRNVRFVFCFEKCSFTTVEGVNGPFPRVLAGEERTNQSSYSSSTKIARGLSGACLLGSLPVFKRSGVKEWGLFF